MAASVPAHRAPDVGPDGMSEGRRAVAGTDLRHAMKVALEVESLCGIYLQVLALGEPALLDADQMAQVLEKFRHYGQAAGR